MTQQHPMLGKILAEDYEITSFLGRGGMGSVFVANQISLNRQVAIKVFFNCDMDSEEFYRFEREIAAMATLSHPHIVPIHNRGKFGNPPTLYFSMELQEGGSLKDHLQSKGKIPHSKAIRLIRPVAEALSFAHEQGYIHRDIKPGNLLFTKNNRSLKIADFGIAKINSSNITRSQSIIGTLVYAAPEQMQWFEDTDEETEIDTRADQYSLGIVFYEMLSGFPPYKAHNLGSLMKALNKPPIPISQIKGLNISPSLEWLVTTMMEKSREKRFSNDEALLAAIDSVDLEVAASVSTRVFAAKPKNIPTVSEEQELSSTELEFIQNLETKEESKAPQAALMTKYRNILASVAFIFIFLLTAVVTYELTSVPKKKIKKNQTPIKKTNVPIFIKLQINYEIPPPKNHSKIKISLQNMDKKSKKTFDPQKDKHIPPGIYKILVMLSGYTCLQNNKIIDISEKKEYLLALNLHSAPREVIPTVVDLATNKVKYPVLFKIDNLVIEQRTNFKPGFYTFFVQLKEYQTISQKLFIPPGNKPYQLKAQLYPLKEITFILFSFPTKIDKAPYPLEIVVDKKNLKSHHFQYHIEEKQLRGSIQVPPTAENIRFQAGYYFAQGSIKEIYLINKLDNIDVDKLLEQLSKLKLQKNHLAKQLEIVWQRDQKRLKNLSSKDQQKAYAFFVKLVQGVPNRKDIGWKLRWLFKQQEQKEANQFYVVTENVRIAKLDKRKDLWQKFIANYPQGIFKTQVEKQLNYYQQVNRYIKIFRENTKDCYLSLSEKRTIANVGKKILPSHVKEIKLMMKSFVQKLNCGKTLEQMLQNP